MILVTGAGGYIGRRLVAHLLVEGRLLRCLVTPQHARALPEDSALETHIHHEPNDALWAQLVDGVHCIIHLRSAMWWGQAQDLHAIEIEGTRALIRAARLAHVGRVILVSHLDASPASGIPTLRIKGAQEQLLRESGLAFTIIRSALVFGEADSFISHLAALLRANPLFFAQPSRGEYLLQPIYVGDLVEAIARSLQRLDVVDETVTVGGPEYLTFTELLRTIMRVTGMQRPLLDAPPYLLSWLALVGSRLLPRSLITEQWLDLVATSRTTGIGNLPRSFGIHPQRLEETLLGYLPRQRHFRTLMQRIFRRRPQRASC